MCPESALRSSLASGPLAAKAAIDPTQRFVHAVFLASVVRYAAPQLQAAGLLQACADSAVRFSKDDVVSSGVSAEVEV